MNLRPGKIGPVQTDREETQRASAKEIRLHRSFGIPEQIDCFMNRANITSSTPLLPERSDGSSARPNLVTLSPNNQTTTNEQQYTASRFLHLLVEPALAYFSKGQL